MKTLYKKIALILTFVLGAINISPAIQAYANTTSNNLSKISCSNEQNSISMPDGIPATELESDSKNERASVSSISTVFIRHSSNSTVVQVYLQYSGTKPANAIKFNEMTIQNTSLIFQKTYGSLVPKVYNFNISATYYNQYIGTVNIPTNVTKVRVQDSGLKAYYVGSGWKSFSNIIGEWRIK